MFPAMAFPANKIPATYNLCLATNMFLGAAFWCDERKWTRIKLRYAFLELTDLSEHMCPVILLPPTGEYNIAGADSQRAVDDMLY